MASELTQTGTLCWESGSLRWVLAEARTRLASCSLGWLCEAEARGLIERLLAPPPVTIQTPKFSTPQPIESRITEFPEPDDILGADWHG
jgi:hypothetical protein